MGLYMHNLGNPNEGVMVSIAACCSVKHFCTSSAPTLALLGTQTSCALLHVFVTTVLTPHYKLCFPSKEHLLSK